MLIHAKKTALAALFAYLTVSPPGFAICAWGLWQSLISHSLMSVQCKMLVLLWICPSVIPLFHYISLISNFFWATTEITFKRKFSYSHNYYPGWKHAFLSPISNLNTVLTSTSSLFSPFLSVLLFARNVLKQFKYHAPLVTKL